MKLKIRQQWLVTEVRTFYAQNGEVIGADIIEQKTMISNFSINNFT